MIFGRHYKKKIGKSPLKNVIPVKIKDNVIFSKQLGYKFILPEGYAVDRKSVVDVWDEKKDYTEFFATYMGATVSVSITPIEMPENVRAQGMDFEKIAKEIIRRVYLNADITKITNVNFVGYRCTHYAGLVDKRCKDGQLLYMEQYIYFAPYCQVVFRATCGENETYKINGIFDCFTEW